MAKKLTKITNSGQKGAQKWPEMPFLGQIKVKKTSDPTFSPILQTHKLVTPNIIGFDQKSDYDH